MPRYEGDVFLAVFSGSAREVPGEDRHGRRAPAPRYTTTGSVAPIRRTAGAASFLAVSCLAIAGQEGLPRCSFRLLAQRGGVPDG